MIRRVLVIGSIFLSLALGCARDVHDELNRELDDMNKKERESKEPVTPGGPLRDAQEFN